MKKKEVSVQGIEKKVIAVEIEGVAPFIAHRFDKKSQTILEGIIKKEKVGRKARDPYQEYLDSIYWIDEKRSGFPAVGFKSAMVRAAKQMDMAMTDVRGRFHVLTDHGDLVEIRGEHRMRTDYVRVASGGSDIRYRAEYPQWEATITIEYNSSAISDVQLLKMLEIAGFACGIGEWRPERTNSGSYGLWRIK